jgi:hypothetical protein
MPVVRGDFVARIAVDTVVDVVRRAGAGGALVQPEDHCSKTGWANTHTQAVLVVKALVVDAVRAAEQDLRTGDAYDLHAGAVTCAKMVARWHLEAGVMGRAETAA